MLLVGLTLVLSLTTLSVVAWAPVQAAAPPTLVSAKINFGPTGAAATPAVFTQDTGAAWTDAAGSGWVREDSLRRHPHAPRPAAQHPQPHHSTCTGGTLQGRTFIHMQAPVTNATNNSTKGAWEYAVPNGQYKVEVGYGDATLGADAESHTLNVEGANFVRNDPNSTGRHVGQLPRQPSAVGERVGQRHRRQAHRRRHRRHQHQAGLGHHRLRAGGRPDRDRPERDLDRARLGRRRRRERLQGVAQRGAARARQWRATR